MDSVLDRAVVDSIKELGDHRSNDSLLRELLELFEGQVELAREGLTVAVAAGDLGKIRQLAHKLKGSSANLGAVLLASRCQLLEHLAKQTVPDHAALRLALAQVEVAMGRSLEQLRLEVGA